LCAYQATVGFHSTKELRDMGILHTVLDELFPKGLALSATQALDAACVSLLSDGEVSDEEVRWLVSFVADLPGDVGEAGVKDALARLNTHGGLEPALKALVSGLSDTTQREQAFAIATAVQHADDEVRPGEDDLLIVLAEVFNLDDGRANEILAVTEQAVAQARTTRPS
jgi:hypothetical protein